MGSHGDSADRLRLHFRPIFRAHPTDARGRARVFSPRGPLSRTFPDLLWRHGFGDFDLGIPLGASLPLERKLCGDRRSDPRGKANAAAGGGDRPRPPRNLRFLRRAVASRIATQREETSTERVIWNAQVKQRSVAWLSPRNQISSSFGAMTSAIGTSAITARA